MPATTKAARPATPTASTAPATLLERERVLGEPATGIVLAGGRSRRMGADKAFTPLAGRPLIAWVLEALEPVTETRLVVTRSPAGFRDVGVRVVHDRLPARGPLTGLHAGLEAAPTDLCLVVACDMPLVRTDLLALLARTIGPFEAAVPYVGDPGVPPPVGAATAREAGLQPLLAAYRRRALPALEKLLRSGSMPTSALVSVVRARIVPPEAWRAVDPEGLSFLNVNTPEDLMEATRRLAGPSAEPRGGRSAGPEGAPSA